MRRLGTSVRGLGSRKVLWWINPYLATPESLPPHSLAWAPDIDTCPLETAGGEVGTIGQVPEQNHDVESVPPAGTARPHRRPSARRRIYAQEMFPRLKIVDPPRPETPFRPYRFPHQGRPGIVERDVSRSFNLSFALRQNSIRWLPRRRHSRRCSRGRLDQRILSRRPFVSGRWRLDLPGVDNLSSSIPRVIIPHQISLHHF